MAGALYMGPSTGLWGSNPVGAPQWGGRPPGIIKNPNPIENASPGMSTAPANVLQPEAIRATGPSQGYDPAYLQNLATSIGGLFSNSQQGGNTMNINPLGNLSEISPSSGIGGNAPTSGLPLTWLQQALNGGGFNYVPPVAPTVKPQIPTLPVINRNPRMNMWQ